MYSEHYEQSVFKAVMELLLQCGALTMKNGKIVLDEDNLPKDAFLACNTRKKIFEQIKSICVQMMDLDCLSTQKSKQPSSESFSRNNEGIKK